MAYINYHFIYEKGLTDTDFHTLQKVAQGEFLLLKHCDKSIKKLIDMELVQYVGDKTPKPENIRINRNGKSVLSQVETPNHREDVIVLCNNLISLYQAYGKETGKHLDVRKRLIWFVANTGFALEIIYKAVETYLESVRDSERTFYLANFIWSPQSKAFSVRQNLRDSPLYDNICRKYNLNHDFFIENKRSVVISWLRGVAELGNTIPKQGETDLYFTGSVKGDLEHIERLKGMYLQEIRKKK